MPRVTHISIFIIGQPRSSRLYWGLLTLLKNNPGVNETGMKYPGVNNPGMKSLGMNNSGLSIHKYQILQQSDQREIMQNKSKIIYMSDQGE